MRRTLFIAIGSLTLWVLGLLYNCVYHEWMSMVKCSYTVSSIPHTKLILAASSYDWTQDQGTFRRFLSNRQLDKELRLRKAVSVSDSFSPPTRAARTMSADSSRPGYLDPRPAINGFRNNRSASLNERSLKWSSR